ncbi:MAG: ATPase, partial [Nanoarchaeota archaeon]
EAIKRYNGLIPFMDAHLSYGQKQVGVCFDDMGTEDDRKNYGNESNVMADVMLNRYDNKRNLIRKTHITTNLTTEEMEQRYGSRVRSRMREMFNLVIFDPVASDRRR